MLLCVASSCLPDEGIGHLASRTEANASLVRWLIAPSENMAAQTDARMEEEDPGLMMCILLLEEVSRSRVIL